MAEVIARADFADRGLPVAVASAGEMEGGEPAAKNAVKAMAARGLDLSEHVSRQMDADILEAAALVLTMERRHLHYVAELDMGAVTRTFPLLEFVRMAPPRPSHQPMVDWIAGINAIRDPRRTLTYDRGDDIEDPMGRSTRHHVRCADALQEAIAALGFALGRPQRPAPSPSSGTSSRDGLGEPKL